MEARLKRNNHEQNRTRMARIDLHVRECPGWPPSSHACWSRPRIRVCRAIQRSGSRYPRRIRADQRAPQPNVLFYGPNETGNTWGVLTPSSNSPNLIDGTGRTVGSFGPEISAGKTISNALGGALVAQVKLAVGGTALFDRWNPAGGDLYASMVGA